MGIKSVLNCEGENKRPNKENVIFRGILEYGRWEVGKDEYDSEWGSE